MEVAKCRPNERKSSKLELRSSLYIEWGTKMKRAKETELHSGLPQRLQHRTGGSQSAPLSGISQVLT